MEITISILAIGIAARSVRDTLVKEKPVVYLIRTVLPSGTLAGSAVSYQHLDVAVRAAGAELKKGFVIDAWIVGSDGSTAADMLEIKRQCGIR